jgi:hypothetical protein
MTKRPVIIAVMTAADFHGYRAPPQERPRRNTTKPALKRRVPI